jgi:toxin-antitoxin system PIN domain toxin
MIVLDANLLIYAYDTASPHHKAAIAWMGKALSGDELVGLPWQTAAAFLRVLTNAKLPGDRFTSEEAAEILDELLDQPNIRLLAPGENHWSWFRRMVTEGQARGPLVSDAELAAITIEYGGVLHTTDRDFARFPGLRWVNPLA